MTPFARAAAVLGERAIREAPLGARTTYRVGGGAALLVEVRDDDDLARTAEAARESGVPVLVVGKGSNLLVADAGFDGIAIALLGRATPAGVVGAAFLFGGLRAGGRSMQAATQTPIEIILVIQAAVIAFVAAPAFVRAIFRIRERRVVGSETFAKGWGG